MQTYSRRALLGSGAAVFGAMFGERVASAQEPADFVLDHAGREMVRLHSRAQLARASTLALTAANLRLLAAHPTVTAAHRGLRAVDTDDASIEQALRALRRSMRERYGYTGTVDDLRNLTIDAPADLLPSVRAQLQAGSGSMLLTRIADQLEGLSIRFDTTAAGSPMAFREQTFTPKPRPIYDPTEGGVAPCTVLAVEQFGIQGIAIIFAMGGAGVVVGGILAGIGLILQIIRYGACG